MAAFCDYMVLTAREHSDRTPYWLRSEKGHRGRPSGPPAPGRAALQSNYILSAPPFDRDSPAWNEKVRFSSYWMPNVVLILLPVATKFPSHLPGLHSISLLLGVIEKSPSERERGWKTRKLQTDILTQNFITPPHPTPLHLSSIHIDSAFSYIVQLIPSADPGLSNPAARRFQIHAIPRRLEREERSNEQETGDSSSAIYSIQFNLCRKWTVSERRRRGKSAL